jgi:hypothetical protein
MSSEALIFQAQDVVIVYSLLAGHDLPIGELQPPPDFVWGSC